MMDARVARMTTWALAGGCALLAALAVVQWAGFGTAFGWWPDNGAGNGPLSVGAIDRQPFALPAASTYAQVEARPLFNEDRKPTPQDATEAKADAGPPPTPLNVTLTGVIVTPQVSIAMIRDNARNQSLSLKVGMPLEGEQAGWTLVSVSPRGAVFANAANEQSNVELQTASTPAAPQAAGRPPGGQTTRPVPGLAPGAPAAPPPPDAAVAGTPGGDSDLAKRIEERRRQMREEADRLRNQQGGKRPAGNKQ